MYLFPHTCHIELSIISLQLCAVFNPNGSAASKILIWMTSNFWLKYGQSLCKRMNTTLINNGPDRDHALWQADRTLVDELTSPQQI